MNTQSDIREWKMKNGKTIKISDMTDSHLNNAIKLIESKTKNGVWGRERVFIGEGYDGDSYVPDFAWVRRKFTQKEILSQLRSYKWLKNEKRKRCL